MPFDGRVVLVDEVRGQWEKLVFGSDFVWFANVLVGHHHGADAHVLSADRHLKRKNNMTDDGDVFSGMDGCLLIFIFFFCRAEIQLKSQVTMAYGAHFSANIHTIKNLTDAVIAWLNTFNCACNKKLLCGFILLANFRHISVAFGIRVHSQETVSASVCVVIEHELFIYRRQCDHITFCLYSFEMKRSWLRST